FLGREADLVNEISATLGAACLFVVCATARDGTPQLRGDVSSGRGATQSRQQPSHALHGIEHALGDIVALTPRFRLVLGSLSPVPSSLLSSSFHSCISASGSPSCGTRTSNREREPEQGSRN